MLENIKIEGYRSIRHMYLKLDRINIITGPNGCGKSNLYKSIYLVSKTATGELAKAIALEGGMTSTLWAGARTAKKPVRLRIEIAIDEFVYGLALGLPARMGSAFILDPIVKKEYIKYKIDGHSVLLMERRNDSVFVRDQDGGMVHYHGRLIPSESILSQISDPQNYPELALFSRNLREWRFFHNFRTDALSPIRTPQVGTYSTLLDHDGANLASTIQTLFELEIRDQVHHFFSRAFPGNKLIVKHENGLFELQMAVPGIRRPLGVREMSDGTLRFICLLAVLLNPDPPELIAINEPEMSLNSDLLGPLAELLVFASEKTQLWITTHSRMLADMIQERSGIKTILLAQRNGQTQLDNSDSYIQDG